MMFVLENILRENIKNLVPYSTARDEYKGKEGVFLDANESPFNTGLNRYPDPQHLELKNALAKLKKVQCENILLGNGSDETIDLIFRTFCEPGISNVIIQPPTYGMYKVDAQINNIKVIEVDLSEEFQSQPENILRAVTQNTRVIFFCSPNNPSGNLIEKNAIKMVLENFNGVVVIDEAYIDFCSDYSWLSELKQYPNLIVMQTMSKAWGMAGVRLGIMYASPEIIAVIHKIKPPYNINILTQRIALEALKNESQKNTWVKAVISQREIVQKVIESLPQTEKIYPSNTNYLLIKFTDANYIFNKLLLQKIIVRDRSNVKLCENCLRISIGTMEENLKLLEALKNM